MIDMIPLRAQPQSELTGLSQSESMASPSATSPRGEEGPVSRGSTEPLLPALLPPRVTPSPVTPRARAYLSGRTARLDLAD